MNNRDNKRLWQQTTERKENKEKNGRKQGNRQRYELIDNITQKAAKTKHNNNVKITQHKYD